MDTSIALFYLCAIAGIVMVVGSLFLLWKGRIILDSKGRVSTIELPFNIKFSTQFPVLVMFFIGAILVTFPVYYAKNICPSLPLHAKSFPEMVKVTGKINTTLPLDVYAIVAEQSNTKEVIFNVPFVKNGSYRIMAADADGILKPISVFSLDACCETYVFRDFEIQPSPESPVVIPKQADNEKPPQSVVDTYK
ncbi:MAG: hypothetical protein H7Y30_15630 [Pyrinomonadaceae bacterium]|nr:hypothetical protein [Pyrinomonadaceae bacterium]